MPWQSGATLSVGYWSDRAGQIERPKAAATANATVNLLIIFSLPVWNAARRRARWSRTRRAVCLLPFVGLDQFVDLSFHGLKVERSRRLHRRIVDRCLGELGHFLLDHHEAPELAGVKVVHVAAAQGVQVFAAGGRRPFKRILAYVVHHRHVGGRFFSGPTVRLLIELELEIVDADGPKRRAAEVKELAACRRSLAGEQVGLIVAVEMVLVVAAVECHALQELLRDVRIASRRSERREPI